MYVQSMICLGYALNACLHVHVHVVVVFVQDCDVVRLFLK